MKVAKYALTGVEAPPSISANANPLRNRTGTKETKVVPWRVFSRIHSNKPVESTDPSTADRVRNTDY